MTADDIRAAMRTHQPFEIEMASGTIFRVAHEDYVSFNLPRTAVNVTLEDSRIVTLPLANMTGIKRVESIETN